MPSTDITLYARWEIMKYTLTIKFNNGQEDQIERIDYNTPLSSYKPENPEKEGTIFLEWLCGENTFDFDTAVMPAQDLIIYALYANEVTIYFQSYDSTIGVTGKTGEEIILPLDPTRIGYMFNGWYLDDNYSNEFTLKEFPKNNLTVYAKWIANEYSILFETNGANELLDPITAPYESDISEFEPNTPTKQGYIFNGWYADKEFTTPYIFTTMPLHGTTIYAKWEEEPDYDTPVEDLPEKNTTTIDKEA
jgi:uncharacterized repeat protein (TIGR02543 family)